MSPESEEGLILRVSPHAEADRLVTWYGPEHGRVTALAKGAAKSKKRFVNKLEPFTRLRFSFRPPRNPDGLRFLEDAELLDAHLPIRRDYPRFLAASCLTELCLRFTRDQDPDPAVYGLLLQAAAGVSADRRFLRFPLFFHLKLLQAVGYMPDLSRCRRCGRAFSAAPREGPAFFALGRQETGGAILVCARCHAGQAHTAGSAAGTPVLAPRTLTLLLRIQETAPPLLNRLHAPPWSIAQGLDLLHRFSQGLLQNDLPAWPLARRLCHSPLDSPDKAF